MPIEDALTLISRNFVELQRYGSTAGHEAAIALLNQLANGRSLTVMQYDRVLEYVKECRDKQAKAEHGDDAGNMSDKTQVDLQQRIMSILNNDTKGTEATATRSSTATDQPKADASNFDNSVRNQMNLRERIASMLNTNTLTQGPVPQPVAPPNLKTTVTNPTIQKALDSIINKMN